MIVATNVISISTEECFSLKEKRSIIKSLKDRLKNNFNISVAEVGSQNNFRVGEIGIAFVSSDHTYADKEMSNIINFIEKSFPGRLMDCDWEIFSR